MHNHFVEKIKKYLHPFWGLAEFTWQHVHQKKLSKNIQFWGLFEQKVKTKTICGKDTLSRGTLCVLTGRRGRLHLLCIGELCEKTCFEILPALILFPTVDEHFVLQDNKEDSENFTMYMRADTHMQADADQPTLCRQKIHCAYFMHMAVLKVWFHRSFHKKIRHSS